MKEEICPQCNGKGEYDLIQKFYNEEIETPVKCTNCDGTGKILFDE